MSDRLAKRIERARRQERERIERERRRLVRRAAINPEASDPAEAGSDRIVTPTTTTGSEVRRG